MKKGFLSLIALFFISMLVSAQAPGIEWQKSLGGTAADAANSVVPTSDGGYIVGGTTLSNDGDVSGNHGGNDYWVIKLNAAGAIDWQKTYGGTGNDYLGSIRPTRDGGYIMGGTTTSNDGDVSGNHGYSDGWLVKLSSTGFIEWQKCFGSSSGDGVGYVEETLDGGYICLGTAGTNDGDLTGQLPELYGSWVFKLSSARNIEWQWALFDGGGISGGTRYYQIRQTSDSGYVYCGFGRGIYGNAFMGKINSAGTYTNSDYVNPGYPGAYEFLAPKCLAPTNDGGCISVRRDQLSNYPAIRKYNSALVLQWEKQLDVFGDARNISTTPDGGYLVSGNLSSGNIPGGQGGNDFWLAKLNGAGTVQWQRMLGSTNNNDYTNWAEAATDSSYIIVGRTDTTSGDVTGNHGGNDFWVVKLPYSSPSFAIISSAGANGTINPNGGLIYPTGINQIFTITPNSGYRIATVMVDGVNNPAAVSSGTYTFSNVNTSHTISVTFAIKTYTIAASAGSNGSISANGVSTFNHGSSYTYNITPSPGYSILDVLVDSVSASPRTSYTFSNITANHTIRAIFSNLDSTAAFICPAGDSVTITSDLTGTSYMWQGNSNGGNLYYNLSDGSSFGGTKTATLTIRNYQNAVFGYKYRCVVDGASSLINVLRYKNLWNGTFDNHWEIPQNWSCGNIPDANTDVEIPAGTNLVISTNITIRSLSLGIGSNVTLAPGGNLTVLH